MSRTTSSIFTFLLLTTLIGLSQKSIAQSGYIPCPETALPKATLIEQIENIPKEEIKRYEGEFKSEVFEIYKQRSEGLVKQINEAEFISCPEIDEYLQNIFTTIALANPTVKRPKLVLVSANPLPNAFCMGEGTLVVTIGLLRRIKTQSELAFVLAHELAHYQLDHVNISIEQSVERYSNKALKKSGLKQDILNGDVDALSSLFYGDFKFKRQFEMEADSLGLLILANTEYDIRAYKSALNILDSTDYPEFKKTPLLEKEFDFSRYPFKRKWLKSNTPEFQNEDSGYLIFNKDSLKTHPDIPLRIAQLTKYYRDANTSNASPSTYKDEFGRLLDYETVAATYRSIKYLPCLYYTLKMTERYPEELYFKKVVVHLMIDLYYMRNDHEFGKYIPLNLTKPTWLISYSDFLNNIRMSEFAELSYHYLQSKITFDQSDEELYYLLWEASHISNRFEVAEKVKKAYLDKFPAGLYADKLSR